MWNKTHNNWKNESSNNFCFFFLQIFLFFFRSTFDCLFSPKQHDLRVGNHRGKKGNPPSATAVWRRMIYEPLVRLPRRSLPSDQPFQARGMRNNCQRVSKIFSHFLFYFFFPPPVERQENQIWRRNQNISNDVKVFCFCFWDPPISLILWFFKIS